MDKRSREYNQIKNISKSAYHNKNTASNTCNYTCNCAAAYLAAFLNIHLNSDNYSLYNLVRMHDHRYLHIQ